jgi:predicted dehydrogenase
MRRLNLLLSLCLVTMSKLLQSQLLRVAVVGVGHLGKWHADKYADSAACELVAVVDTSIDNARAVANQHGADAYSDYRDVIPLVGAISLVVPTSLHYKITREFLEAGIHCLIENCLIENCLIEKSITETEAEVTELSEIAAAQELVLQVRHIDIILDLIDRPVKQISARGISVLSGNVDNAALNLELLDFIDAIHQQRRPLVNAVGGRRALATAIAITQLHQQKVFADTRQPFSQVTESTARRCPSLPIFPEMTGQQVSRVCAAVRGNG